MANAPKDPFTEPRDQAAPDAGRALTTEEEQSQRRRTEATNWVLDKWTSAKHCPVCNERDFTISDVQEIRPLNRGEFIVGGPFVPIFLVLCDNCGYTLMFNAMTAGIVTE